MKNRKIILSSLLMVGFIATLSGCDTDTETNSETETETESSGEIVYSEASQDIDPATDEEITEVTALVADIDGTYIGLLDGGSITNSEDVTIESNIITISEGGTYSIIGTLTEGQIIVDTSDAITLNLMGVDINCSDSAAIYIIDADEGTTINLVEGTTNTLTDSSTRLDEEVTGVLYSKDNLTMTGTGTLTIDANYNDALVSKDSLTIESGTYIIDSVGDAIYGKDDLTINGGTFDIETNGGSDAAPVNEEEMDMHSRPGTTTTTTEEETDDGSQKGLKSQGIITINGGTITLDSYEDAIHSDDQIIINGGTLTLEAGDDAIHADNSIIINDGTIDINYAYEAIEAFSIIINGGDIDIYAYDDGLNASTGVSTSVGGSADDPDYGEYVLDETPHIIINGGTVNVSSDGDGIDANGVVIINGGEVYVNGKGSTSGMIQSPIDFDITGIVNGGTVIALGSSSMAYQFDDEDSEQNSFKITFSGNFASGVDVEVSDEDGTVLGSMTSTDIFQTIIFSSEELEQGETYTITIDGNSYTLTLSTTSSVTVAR